MIEWYLPSSRGEQSKQSGMKSSQFGEFLYSSPDHGAHLRYNLYVCITGANPRLIRHGSHQSLVNCWFKLSRNTSAAFHHRSLFHLKRFDIIFIPVITLFMYLVYSRSNANAFLQLFHYLSFRHLMRNWEWQSYTHLISCLLLKSLCFISYFSTEENSHELIIARTQMTLTYMF